MLYILMDKDQPMTPDLGQTHDSYGGVALYTNPNQQILTKFSH